MIHIHIGPADADILMLYKYLPFGLSKAFKQVLLAYYGGKKHTLPTLKLTQKKKIEDVKVYLNDEEKKILKPLLDLQNKSTVIKNLVRMYYAKTLADICRPVFNASKETKHDIHDNVKHDNVIHNNARDNDIHDNVAHENVTHDNADNNITHDNHNNDIHGNVTHNNDIHKKPGKMPNLFIPKEY